jgi:hypothetical protein
VEACTYTTRKKQETNIHTLSGILTRDPSNRAAAELRLRQRGPWDWSTLNCLLKSKELHSYNELHLKGCLLIFYFTAIDLFQSFSQNNLQNNHERYWVNFHYTHWYVILDVHVQSVANIIIISFMHKVLHGDA